MRRLQRLANERHAQQQQLTATYQDGLDAARKKRFETQKPAEQTYQAAIAHAHDLDAGAREDENAENARVTSALRREYQQRREELDRRRKQAEQQAKKKRDEGGWEIKSVYDSRKDRPRVRLEEVLERIKKMRTHLTETHDAAADVLQTRLLGMQPDQPPQSPASAEPDAGATPTDDQVEARVQAMEGEAHGARDTAQLLYDGWLSRLFDAANLGVFLLAVFAITFVATAATVGLNPLERSLTLGAAAAAGVVAIVCAVLWLVVRPAGRRQSRDRYQQVLTPMGAALQHGAQAEALATLRATQHQRQLVEQRDADLKRLDDQVAAELDATLQRITTEREEIDQQYPARLRQARDDHQAAIERFDKQLQQSLQDATATRDQVLRESEQLLQETEARLTQQRDAAWAKMKTAWLDGCSEISEELAAQSARCERLFPNWEETQYQSWDKPQEPSLAVEFGRATLNLATIKHGLPEDPSLRPQQTVFQIPTLVTLREQPSLLISAEGEARRQAVELLKAVTLRFLTGQPPGKVRMTLLDPMGLGEGLSPFMHLADYEEDLISGRIWSEARDIDEQLGRLTAHMETVIQKYLRSEYDTIHEYNAQAGEVAEPFHLLVANGFPYNFTDSAAKRLVTLASRGPQCGVYVLATIDERQRLPTDFNLDDLRADAVNLHWDAQRHGFTWRYPAFEHLPLETATPPQSERMIEVIRQAGDAARDAIKVEVPFSVVAPDGEFWRQSCASELRVPVGRAGAKRLQDVRLGRGTSQHLLVAGKTGSGKSTFLHALVTSAALHYAPSEVEFYLVDFKKGVEFKSYANNRLPHARVIAVESEREFGLSVLERLDKELTRRGELYRECGAQNVADFRAANPNVPMPRILLVIDEFQELFTEDDRLAQESTLLLDRLVRQGRAFGVHVILGTQTLAGAYSIARSTLGQIAVRVALECSEADSHLILADERNQAARFLSRPGEAIYNDQNGLVSANEPFQVVWLPDGERAERLAELDNYRSANGLPEADTIVFEGNAPADPGANQLLLQQLQAPAPADEAATTGLPPTAYLGDSVSIGPPAHAEFGRHAGANLLVVGSQENAALGVMAASVLSLAASAPGARVVILDGSRPGETSHGVWQQVLDAARAECELVDPRNAAGAIGEIAQEVGRRDAEDDANAQPIYLVVWSGGRFRDLRKSEDDFSFSMSSDDKPASADKNLAEVLQNGPSLGVHTLVWVDGYNQAARMFDRATMREFALRVAFQMSAADSSNLLDSPAAANLKQHRALLYNDETGAAEKFRPYGAPSAEWLASLAVGSAVRTED